MRSICVVLVSIGFSLPAFAGTMRVSQEDAPYSSGIQEAIDASTDGDVVLVAPGEYRIFEPIDYRGKSIEVRSVAGAARTVIRMAAGSGAGSVVVFESGESSSAVLSGFTITGGFGTLYGEVSGGGILCVGGSNPTLENLIVTENRAVNGGALFCADSSPTLRNCELSANSVRCGGGAYCDASSPTFVGCTISGNRGTYASSGVHSKHGSAPLLIDCRIVGNETVMGGAIDCFDSTPVLFNCILAGNRAATGGAVHADRSAPELWNCVVAGNLADQGGDFFLASASPLLVNTTVWDNTPPAGPLPATNCLMDQDPRFLSTGVFDHDRYRWVTIAGETVELPDFVVETPDYRLRPDSPCIDAGTADGASDSDADGAPRPCGLAVDIGAYEFCGGSAIPFRRGDANADGQRNLVDAVFVLSFLFGPGVEPPCLKAADSDGSGLLDLTDAVRLLSFLFSSGPPPEAPFIACGTDRTVDGLDCRSFSACP